MSRQSAVRCSSNRKNRTLPPLFQFCAGQLAIAGLFAMAIPSSPATAASFNPFQVCAGELVRANISLELASQACAQALAPQDVSLCVLRIKTLTAIAVNDALVACTRVRRPLELASCVVDINERTQDPEANSVLGYCRRSLLPVRFSECVIGLSREVDFSPASALTTCSAAED